MAAQALGLVGFDERFERAVGGWVDMERDRRQSAMADTVVSVLVEMRAAHVGLEKRDALRGFHSGQPDERQSTRIQGAIFRSDANSHDLFCFQAKQHDELPRSFELYGSGLLRCARRAIMIFF